MQMQLRPDSAPIRFLSRIFDLIILSVLTIVTCALVIPAGAALLALYTVSLKMVRSEDHRIVRSFFRALRENLVSSVPVAVLLYADGMLILFLFRVLWAEDLLLAPPVFILLWIFAVLLTALLSWLVPLMARYENPFPRQLLNAAGLAAANLPITCLVALVNLLPVILVTAFPEIFGYVAAVWTFLATGTGAYVNSFYFRRCFDCISGVPEETEDARDDGEEP